MSGFEVRQSEGQSQQNPIRANTTPTNRSVWMPYKGQSYVRKPAMYYLYSTTCNVLQV